MPNHKRLNKKKDRSRRRLSARADGGVHSVKDLLGRADPALARFTAQNALRNDWQQWLESRLPDELRPRVTGVVERENTLVVFAESAGWSVRLRYALAEIEAELRQVQPAIARVSVRVMPRSSS